MCDAQEWPYIQSFCDTSDASRQDTLLGHLLRLTRRDVVSSAAIANIRKMSTRRHYSLFRLAFKFLSPYDFKKFVTKVKVRVGSRVRVARLTLKLPFGSRRIIQRLPLRVLREVL